MLKLWTKLTNGTAYKLGTIKFVQAITLAKIAKFFMIPIVIWSKNASDSISLRLVLVNGYYFLSLMHVLSILTGCSRKTSTLMTMLTIIIKLIVIIELTQKIKNFLII